MNATIICPLAALCAPPAVAVLDAVAHVAGLVASHQLVLARGDDAVVLVSVTNGFAAHVGSNRLASSWLLDA